MHQKEATDSANKKAERKLLNMELILYRHTLYVYWS